MGLFAKKVAEAKPSENTGLFFNAGQYPVIQIDSLKYIISKKPGREGTEMFIIVCDVLDSKVADRPPGTRGVSQTLNSQHPGAADDCKRFIQALFPDVDPATIDEAAITALTSSEQPAHGLTLSLECYVKKNDKTHKEFTKHIWRPLTPEVRATVPMLRSKAGLPPLKTAAA